MCSLHISLHIWHLYLIQFVLILLLNSLSSLSKNTRIVDRFYYSNCGTFELLKDNSNERHLVFHLTCHFYMQEIAKWFYVKIPHNPFYIYAELRKSPSDSSHTSWNLTLVLCVIDLSCCSARQQSPLDSKTLLPFARQQNSAPFCCTANSAPSTAPCCCTRQQNSASFCCTANSAPCCCTAKFMTLQTLLFYINTPASLRLAELKIWPPKRQHPHIEEQEELVTFVSSRTLHTLLFEELSDFNKSNYWRSKWPSGQLIYWPTINNPTVAACD